MNSIKKVSRKDLYIQVWSKPISKLASTYGISDVWLRKICLKYNIPMPPRGYWQKLEFGKRTEIPKLPILKDFEDQLISLSVSAVVKPPSSGIMKLNRQIDHIEKNNKEYALVPEKLTSPSKLITEAKESLQNKVQMNHDCEGVYCTQPGELNIEASEINFNRALRIMDTFIKLAEQRGHRIEVRSTETLIFIGDADIEIAIRERFRFENYTNLWGDIGRRYVSSGKLVFRLDKFRSKEWEDGAVPLEKKLARILATIELRGMELIESWERSRKAQLIREKEQEQIRLAKLAREKEEAQLKKLIEDARKWEEYNLIAKYIEAVKEAALNQKDAANITAWIKWASDRLNNMNPINNIDL